MTDEMLLTFVADIVSAHVSHNSVSFNELPTLIKTTYNSLANLNQVKAPVEEKRTPATPIHKSVKSDGIVCLECGAKFKMLKRHLSTDHGLTPIAYRSRWSLPASYPIVAPDYAAVRKALAAKIGLGRKQASTPSTTVDAAAPAVDI